MTPGVSQPATLFSSMSTTSATASSTSFPSAQSGIRPDRAYDELVFHNPEFCSQCHRQIRAYDDYRPEVQEENKRGGAVSKYAPEERYRRAFGGAGGYRVQDMDAYGELRVHRPTSYCSECGSQQGRADGSRTLSESAALDAARYLVGALEHQDVDLDRGALYKVVKEGKSRRDLQGHDSDLFRKAAEFAIKRARYDA